MSCLSLERESYSSSSCLYYRLYLWTFDNKTKSSPITDFFTDCEILNSPKSVILTSDIRPFSFVSDSNSLTCRGLQASLLKSVLFLSLSNGVEGIMGSGRSQGVYVDKVPGVVVLKPVVSVSLSSYCIFVLIRSVYGAKYLYVLQFDSTVRLGRYVTTEYTTLLCSFCEKDVLSKDGTSFFFCTFF